ncbi:Guanine nucleotide-binding protein alpha-2 subunit, variant 3 [Entomophthora muscae]|uniref:Guanine nucleotide-binding protein alpha-2 subunit, variant 3 n=1 Tax=Entomophthora muscae TaxID=34485 RepID=A0ACC2T385_9FUNG|nr:Guanine nucleotide-binding protein alpha-2 subunit, variant 3 [Entomophthora muscae]
MKKASYIDHNKIELVASLPSIYSESAALTPSTPVPKRSRSFFRFFPVIMGACLSAEERVIRERNTQIDRIIEEDSKRFSKECKILLLGSGESGKSTIVKQMKIIHQNGYNMEELNMFRPIIYKNVVDCVRDLVRGYESLNLKPVDSKNEFFLSNYQALLSDLGFSGNLPPEFVCGVQDLVKDPRTTECMHRNGEFYILDSAPYFFEHIQRIGASDYIPSVSDVLRARTKTTGIIETRFTMGQLNIHMFDVGGQRSERKKWIHCFEAVTSIIFCVALSEYDQVLLEECGQNRMTESLVLFESIINSRWFIRTSIILFLNKIDIFRQKIPRSPLNKFFPDYTGGPDINKAAKYILWRFSQTNIKKLVLYPQ